MTSQRGTDPLCVVIGASLRRIREELGISQNGLAAAMAARGASHWTAATVSALETGRRNVSLSELADLLDVLNLSLRDFLAAPEGAEPQLRQRILTLTRSSWDEDIPDPRRQAEVESEVELALRAARQRRLQEHVWATLVGGHPTPQDRLALEEAAQAVFGQGLIDERDSRARRNPSGARIKRAILGHATRYIIDSLRPHFEKEGGS